MFLIVLYLSIFLIFVCNFVILERGYNLLSRLSECKENYKNVLEMNRVLWKISNGIHVFNVRGRRERRNSGRKHRILFYFVINLGGLYMEDS